MNSTLLADSMMDNKIPRSYIYILVVICAFPSLLNLLGFDFSSINIGLDQAKLAQLQANELLEMEFSALGGAFVHTLLEWSAVCIAAFVAFLSLSYYKATGDVTAPIIGIAFFMAGCMDAFHTLTADRLIEAVADNRDLVPFTWAICRIFNALILIVGVMLLLASHRPERGEGKGTGFVIGIGFLFGITAYIIINISATSTQLPVTTFPDAVITRPYDALPLVLFLISGIFVYPLLFKHYPSLFSHALILSAIPQVATQLHMTFGSAALFDNHFNIGHFLKIVAYAVPLAGLSLDYIRSQQRLKDSESRQRSTVDTLFDGVVTINGKGIVQSFNQAAINVFGYTPEEVIGKNVNMLMPEPFHSNHDGYIKHFRETGEARIIGIGREVVGRRKDGSTFPMELGISEFSASGKFMFTGVVRDITKDKQAEDIKSQFISTVSHELRTPLTSIRGALGLVLGKESDRLTDKARSLLEVADRNSERLTLLINDLLDLEKIESNQIEFNLVSTDLVTVARQAMIDNEGYALRHQVQLVEGPMPEQAVIYADEFRLAQVFSNLISNAVKYSSKAGEVEISITQHEDGYRTTVRDHGSGIPEEFHDRIFQRFAQADSSDTREKGGTGLGLSITKAIVEQHGGHIDFESELGTGTVFQFYLPAGLSSEQ